VIERWLHRIVMGTALGALAFWAAFWAIDLLFRPLGAYTVWTVLGGVFLAWLAYFMGVLSFGVLTKAEPSSSREP
jgi:hypothetical protein